MVRKVLEVKNLEVSFEVEDGIVNAVRGIDYCINEGEVLAIVGESGSGKSVATKAITKLFKGIMEESQMGVWCFRRRFS